MHKFVKCASKNSWTAGGGLKCVDALCEWSVM